MAKAEEVRKKDQKEQKEKRERKRKKRKKKRRKKKEEKRRKCFAILIGVLVSCLQASQRAADMFLQQVDANNDGTLSRQEVLEAIRAKPHLKSLVRCDCEVCLM